MSARVSGSASLHGSGFQTDLKQHLTNLVQQELNSAFANAAADVSANVSDAFNRFYDGHALEQPVGSVFSDEVVPPKRCSETELPRMNTRNSEVSRMNTSRSSLHSINGAGNPVQRRMSWMGRHRRSYQPNYAQSNGSRALFSQISETSEPVLDFKNSYTSLGARQAGSVGFESEANDKDDDDVVSRVSETTIQRRSSLMSDVSKRSETADPEFGKKLQRRQSVVLQRSQTVALKMTDRSSSMNHSRVWDLDADTRESEGQGNSCHRCRSFIKNIVRNDIFQYLSCAVVLANVVFLGVEANFRALYWTMTVPDSFKWCELAFCILFGGEILLRMCGKDLFANRRDWRWDMLDIICLGAQVVDEISEHFGLLHKYDSAASLIRMLKLLRLGRVARVLELSSDMRMLMVAIFDTMHTMLQAFLLLFVLMYTLSVFLTGAVTEEKILAQSKNSEVNEHILEVNFGSVPMTMLTLFESVASGLSWKEVITPLWVQPVMAFVFLFYIAFTLFIVLNIVTGINVESATSAAATDKRKVLMQHLHEFFKRADTEKSGKLTMEKFESMRHDPKLQMFLREVDLDGEEAEDLFKLLDLDGSNEIDADEFVQGCLRLHGPAKAIDLATLMYEWKQWTQEVWEFHAARLEDNVQILVDQS